MCDSLKTLEANVRKRIPFAAGRGTVVLEVLPTVVAVWFSEVYLPLRSRLFEAYLPYPTVVLEVSPFVAAWFLGVYVVVA